MENFLRAVSLGLAWTSLFVFAGFFLLFLSRKYRIDWLTKFLSQPAERGRPPSWLVILACAMLLFLTLAWYALPAEHQHAVWLLIHGPQL